MSSPDYRTLMQNLGQKNVVGPNLVMQLTPNDTSHSQDWTLPKFRFTPVRVGLTAPHFACTPEFLSGFFHKTIAGKAIPYICVCNVHMYAMCICAHKCVNLCLFKCVRVCVFFFSKQSRYTVNSNKSIFQCNCLINCIPTWECNQIIAFQCHEEYISHEVTCCLTDAITC